MESCRRTLFGADYIDRRRGLFSFAQSLQKTFLQIADWSGLGLGRLEDDYCSSTSLDVRVLVFRPEDPSRVIVEAHIESPGLKHRDLSADPVARREGHAGSSCFRCRWGGHSLSGIEDHSKA